MKTLSLLITLLFSVNSYSITDGFQELSPQDPLYSLYDSVRVKAVSFITIGTNKMGDSDAAEEQRIVGRKVKEQLKHVKFALAVNESSCAAVTSTEYVFVNHKTPGYIYVCKQFRDVIEKNPIDQNKNTTAQLFIHEGSHLAIYRNNECEATQFELDVMKNTKVGIQDTVNLDLYSKRCGNLRESYKYLPTIIGLVTK